MSSDIANRMYPRPSVVGHYTNDIVAGASSATPAALELREAQDVVAGSVLRFRIHPNM